MTVDCPDLIVLVINTQRASLTSFRAFQRALRGVPKYGEQHSEAAAAAAAASKTGFISFLCISFNFLRALHLTKRRCRYDKVEYQRQQQHRVAASDTLWGWANVKDMAGDRTEWSWK